MIELGGFALLRPLWLLAVPAVAVAAWLLARQATRLAGWELAVDPALLEVLGRLGRVVPGSGRRDYAVAATAALIALALVGPALQKRESSSFRNLDGVVLAVDLSRSIAEGGDLPKALTAARQVAVEAGARPVALVVYAGDAYLATTFTTDSEALGTMIGALDAETVPDPGSRPERALALARQVLGEAQVLAGDVVLVSDGGGIGQAALQEAGTIAGNGGRVSALAVAGRADAPSGLLDALARAGGGTVSSVVDPGPVAGAIGGRRPSRLAADELPALIWADYGRWLLALALLPALLLFRRRA